MSRSQETFLKKQREKERQKKKREKQEKRETRREQTDKGLEIDWSSAPQNSTLTQEEEKLRASNKSRNEE